MELLSELLEKVIAPFLYPLEPSQRIHVLYLGTALLLAFVVYNAGTVRRGGTILPAFLRHCFPRRIYAHRSAWVDYKYFVVNAIAQPLILGPILIGSAATTGWTVALLAALAGSEGLGLASGAWATLLMTVCLLLAADFGIFFAHYLQHKVPALWEFHKVHHSAEVLTPITVYRMHPVDNLLTGTCVGILEGLVYGLFTFVFAELPGLYAAFGLNAGFFLFYLAGYNLRHSHIWLAYPRAISHVLVSPAQHQIHHSLDPKHFDRNLGFVFAFWDWLAGTLYVPAGKEELSFGLDGGEHEEFDSVWALYLRPFRRLLARLRPSRSLAP